MALKITNDSSTLIGMRDYLYPTGFVAPTGYVRWSQLQKSIRLQCDTKTVNPNPSPIIDDATGMVYYSCGMVWYAFWVKNGTLYNYGSVVPDSSGNFVTMILVDGVLYTTELSGAGNSYITAWRAGPLISDIDFPTGADENGLPTTSPSWDDAPVSKSARNYIVSNTRFPVGVIVGAQVVMACLFCVMS
jgi:hypothetical protein